MAKRKGSAGVKRKSITKKVRFEVFKRDDFTCQYCGKKPPDVMLEIDHLKPISKNGSDNINNLITSCFDCNRGKSNVELDKLPNSLKLNYDILQEKQLQLKEYQKLINKIERSLTNNVEKINSTYKEWNEGFELTDKFKNATVKMFLKKIDFHKVNDAMNIACSKMNHKDNSIKYFCGICWKIIKGEVYEN